MKPFLKYILLMIVCICCTKKNDYTPLEIPGSPEKPPPENTEETLAVYIDPAGFPGVPQSSIYEVTLIQGTFRVKIPVFINECPIYEADYMDMTPTDKIPLDMFTGRSISWVNFSFDETVTVEVKLIDTEKVPIEGAVVKILPTRYGITPSVSDNIITFTITKPGQCSVEIGANGYKNGLMIFANPMETDIPDLEQDNSFAVLGQETGVDVNNVSPDKTGLYFKTGVHDIGAYAVPAHIKNIYFEGGAWVYGALQLSGNRGNSDLKIFGRGVLSSGRLKYRESYCIGTPQDGTSTAADRITLDGITVADSKYFAVRLIGQDNLVAWTKVIGGWTYNCDGIAAFAGSTVKNCFCWANDDNIKVYRNNVTFEDMVLWQLNNGGAIQMGWHGADATNVNVRRVDILHAEWNNSSTNRGVLSFVGNRYGYENSYCSQKNMTIEDLVTETPVRLIWRISPEQTIPETITPSIVDGLNMKNWNVLMDKAQGSNNYIEGSTADYIMKNFVFDNVILNGVKLTAENWMTEGRFEIKNLDTPTFK